MTNENEICKDCGGLIKIRNPTGKCDHLYYPENRPKMNPSEKKGCGKIFVYELNGDFISTTCGNVAGDLCPECSKQNHSPYNSSSKGRAFGSVGVKSTGTSNSKQETLSDKIDYEIAMINNEGTFGFIDERDVREFIAKLKEELRAIKESDWCKVGTKDQQQGRKGALDRSIDEIDKLAGEALAGTRTRAGKDLI